jgi:hypothetical protein
VRLRDFQRGHAHDWKRVRVVADAPTAAGGYTAFVLLRCACGVADVFPLAHFMLTTDAYQELVRAELRPFGYLLHEQAAHVDDV